MIDLAMLTLIRAYVQQQIPHSAMSLGHFPVLDRNRRRSRLLPSGEEAGVEGGDLACVGDYGFFFEVADEAVAGCWRDEVGEEEGVEEEALSGEDGETHQRAGRGELEEGEEVHAFVVGFFEELEVQSGGVSTWGFGGLVDFLGCVLRFPSSRCRVSCGAYCGGGGACRRLCLGRLVRGSGSAGDGFVALVVVFWNASLTCNRLEEDVSNHVLALGHGIFLFRCSRIFTV